MGTWTQNPTCYTIRWEAQRTVTITVRKKVAGKVRVTRKSVQRWTPIAGATTTTLTPPDSLKGFSVHVCVRAIVRNRKSAWRCSVSVSPVQAAAVTDTQSPPADTPIPPADTPIPPADTPIPPADTPIPLSILFPQSAAFINGRSAELITPTVTGGSGTKSFAFSNTLAMPDGVTLNQATGTFTGRLTITDDSGTTTFVGATFDTR